LIINPPKTSEWIPFAEMIGSLRNPTDKLALGLIERETDADGDMLRLTDALGDTDADGEMDGETDADGETLALGETLGLTDALGETL
jgi:hypothetical protein